MYKSISKFFAAVSFVFIALPSSAGVILSSDFSGTSGDASNIVWNENGVLVSDLDSSLSPLTLFASKPDMIAVKHNIHNVGSWSLDVLLTVASLTEDLTLGTLSFDASILNNSGSYQLAQRDLAFTLVIYDGVTAIYSELYQVFDGDQASTKDFNATASVVYDLSSIVLSAGSDYTFSLIASGTGGGNNAGLDNLVLTSTELADSVSVPESIPFLFASGFLLLIAARKKQLKSK